MGPCLIVAKCMQDLVDQLSHQQFVDVAACHDAWCMSVDLQA